MRLRGGGFTLIEVLMSLVVGLLVITSVGKVLDTGIFMATDSRNQIYASNALKEEMETLRRTAFDTIVSYGAASAFTNTQVARLPQGAGTRSVAAGLGTDMRKVTLTVTWRARNGATLAERLTTYISRAGVNGT